MQLTKAKRQAIIDGYLNTTRRNIFVPAEFIDWLSGKSDHDAYGWFFTQDDESAARAYRVDMARRFVSGLRIIVRSSAPSESKVVHVKERVYPAYVSPPDGRSEGGGYFKFDPENPDHREQLRIEGAKAMTSWIERYGSVFADMDLSTCNEISAAQAARVVIAAE